MKHAMRLMWGTLIAVLCMSMSAFALNGIDLVPPKASGYQSDFRVVANTHYSKSPQNVVGCYTDDRGTAVACYSVDGGKRWEIADIPVVWKFTADPSVACDLKGNSYICYVSHDGSKQNGKCGVFVTKSFDGGRWWEQPVGIEEQSSKSGTDRPAKCAIAVDMNPKSPYKNYIYVAWQAKSRDGLHSDIFLSVSRDEGESFSRPVKVNDGKTGSSFAAAPSVFVGAESNVYVTWGESYSGGGAPGDLIVDMSSNGGSSFGTDERVAGFLAPPRSLGGCPGVNTDYTVSGTADPSDPNTLYIVFTSDKDGYFNTRIDGGEPQGRAKSLNPYMLQSGNYVFAAWQDLRNGYCADIYFNRSTDNGCTWLPMAVGPLDASDTPGAHTSGWVRLASNDKFVYAAFEDKRSASTAGDIYFCRSTNFGVSWEKERLLDLDPTTTSLSPSITCSGSNVAVAFVDFRNGNPDVYCVRSTDNGVSWSNPVRVDRGDAKGKATSVSPRLCSEGKNVYCYWSDNRTGKYQPWFNYSTDGGATWQDRSKILANSTAKSTLPLHGGIECQNNIVHVIFTDGRTGKQQMYYNRSTNGGVDWVGDVKINDVSAECFEPDLAVEGSSIFIAWQDNRKTGDGGDVYVDFSTDSGKSWQTKDIGPLDNKGVGKYAGAADIEVDGNNAYVSWYDERLGFGSANVYMANSVDGGKTWSDEMLINTGTAPHGLAQQVPYIAAGNGFVTAVWSDPRCVAAGSGESDIFINNSGDGCKTWMNGRDESDVLIIKSSDAGLSWSTPTVVSTESTPCPDVKPRIEVDKNGYIHVAYFQLVVDESQSGPSAARFTVVSSKDGGSGFGDAYVVRETEVTTSPSWAEEER